MGCAPSTLNEPQPGLGGKAAAGATTTATSLPSTSLPRSNSRSFRKQPSPARAVALLLSRKSRVVGGSGADDDAEGVGAFFSRSHEPGVGAGSFGLSEDLWDCLPGARAAASAEAEAAAAAAAAERTTTAAPSSLRSGGGGGGGAAAPEGSSALARKGGSVAAASAGGSGTGATPRGSFLSLARDTLAGALCSPIAAFSDSRPGTATGRGGGREDLAPDLEEEEIREALTDEQFRERITTSGGARALALPSAGFAARYAFCSLRGFYPETPDKRNQDAVCAHERFGGEPEALLLAVFDGHGNHGAACSQFAMDALPAALLADSLCKDAPELALRDAAATANRALHASPIDDSLSGTTALVTLLVKDRLLVANVGDSRAVVGVARPPPPNGSGGVAAVALSWDHTPFRRDEYERVLRAGARVLTLDQMEGLKDPSRPCWTSEDADSADPPRLWMPDALYPGTAFTRSLGDAAAERIGVIPDPEVRPRTLTASDRFLVLASDGVWEFMTNQEVVDLVASEEARGDPQRACVLLCVEAFRRWLLNETRTDDITAAVLWFDGEPGANKSRNKDGGGASSSLKGASSADGGSAVAAAIQRASMVSPRKTERERERERESERARERARERERASERERAREDFLVSHFGFFFEGQTKHLIKLALFFLLSKLHFSNQNTSTGLRSGCRRRRGSRERGIGGLMTPKGHSGFSFQPFFFPRPRFPFFLSSFFFFPSHCKIQQASLVFFFFYDLFFETNLSIVTSCCCAEGGGGRIEKKEGVENDDKRGQ